MSQLRLAALDDTDLAIISAHVQDAVVKVGDLDYRPAEQRFAMALNRFAWEERRGWFQTRFERRRAALSFDRVERVVTSGLDRRDAGRVLSLLAIRFLPRAEAPAGTVELAFSGDATIRLEVECLEVRLKDLGAAWETAALPRHEA